jgi:rSAM/selenodomain-associated transferase 2
LSEDEPELSIIIPVRNDAISLAHLLAELRNLRSSAVEVIVVDGQSSDDSKEVARQAGATVIDAPPGRGSQLNAGFLAARGEWIWMLHADSRISQAALIFIRSLPTPGWGRFDIEFHPEDTGMRLVGGLMNIRSRLTGISTGDQGIFAHRRLLEGIGGIPEQPLMEDVELCRRLKRLSSPIASRVRLVTSSRRWRRDGHMSTILNMWRLRIRYWSGDDPEALARDYYR